MQSMPPAQHAAPDMTRSALPQASESTRTSWKRGWKNGLLFTLALLLLETPLVADAAPFYEYFYTGNPFTNTWPYTPPSPIPDTSHSPNDPRNGGFLSLKITSPTPLLADSADQNNTPGLHFYMSDTANTLQYHGFHGPLDPRTEGVFHYVDASLVVSALNAAGLPTAWNIYIEEEWTDGRRPGEVKFLNTSYNISDHIPWDESYINQYGSGRQYVINNPGQWRLFVNNDPTTVPEPSVPLLFGAGFIALATVRRWKQKSPET